MDSTFLDLRKIRDDIEYMFIDTRYFIDDQFGEEKVERRLALTFGPNITIEMCGRSLAPPLQSGEKVYGLCEVEVAKDNTLRITDSWLTSYPAEEKQIDEITNRANEILSEISDEEYSTYGVHCIDKTMRIRQLDNLEPNFD